MRSLNSITVFLLLVSFFNDGMAKRVVGLMIFRCNNSQIEYLMLKPSKAGKDWSPPKGRIDEGEDDFSAALRETEEEVGFTADDLKIHRNDQIVINSTTKKKGKEKITIFWPAELKSINKNPTLSSEHSEYRWLNKDDASALYVPESIDMFTQIDKKINTCAFH